MSDFWSLQNVLQISWKLRKWTFAFLILQKWQYDNCEFHYQNQNAQENCEISQSLLPVLVSTPNCSPVNNPDEINQSRECDKVPESLPLIRMIVIPESQYEEKQRQIVIRSFEVCKYGKSDDREEEFVNVLNHVESGWYRSILNNLRIWLLT